MIPGKEVTIGEKKYILPPLSLGQLRNGVMVRMREHDEMITAGKGYEAMLLKGDIILAALQRNYPKLKIEDLDSILDFGNINDLWLQALGLAGFRPGEAPTTEEAIPIVDGT